MSDKNKIAKIYLTRCFEEVRDKEALFTFGYILDRTKDIRLSRMLKKEVPFYHYTIKPIDGIIQECDIDKNLEYFNCTFITQDLDIHKKTVLR